MHQHCLTCRPVKTLVCSDKESMRTPVGDCQSNAVGAGIVHKTLLFDQGHHTQTQLDSGTDGFAK